MEWCMSVKLYVVNFCWYQFVTWIEFKIELLSEHHSPQLLNANSHTLVQFLFFKKFGMSVHTKRNRVKQQWTTKQYRTQTYVDKTKTYDNMHDVKYTTLFLVLMINLVYIFTKLNG